MATQMIAKALILKALGILSNVGSLGGNFNAGAMGSVSGIAGGDGGIGSLAGNFKFAEGGFVNGPTNALIGEGGESEYVIPSSKMSAAMSNYSMGKRGGSVIADSGSGGGESGGGGGTFTLETVMINSVEYATVDQVRAMGAQATKQGAEGGFSKSMGSLRNSRSQRSRLGMR
jgi:hypothetical protein